MISIKKLKLYCSDDITLIENFNEAVNSDIKYHCHHRLEIQTNGVLLSRQYLIDNDLYYNRPANELLLLPVTEHVKLHKKYQKPWQWTSESKAKLSKSMSGEGNPFYGKKHSDVSRQKISDSNKGRSSWNKGLKTGNLSNEHKLKISFGMKGKNAGQKNGMSNKHWYTNGKDNICCYECPKDFYPGRTIYKNQKNIH